MAGARGSARRELVARLVLPRRNRRRGTGPGLGALGRALSVALPGALAIGLALAACDRPIPRVASRAIAPPEARSHPAELPTRRSEPRALPEPLREDGVMRIDNHLALNAQ